MFAGLQQFCDSSVDHNIEVGSRKRRSKVSNRGAFALAASDLKKITQACNLVY